MVFHKIMVPVNGGAVDEEVLKLACMLARKGRAKIHVVYVVEVKRALPLDAMLEAEIQKGEKALSQAEQLAEEEECEVESSLLQAREVGPALVQEALEREADLLLMGITYKRRFGEFNLGESVPYVLRNAPCPVFLYRQPPLEGRPSSKG